MFQSIKVAKETLFGKFNTMTNKWRGDEKSSGEEKEVMK